MTYQTIKNLGLRADQVKNIMSILYRSSVGGKKIMSKDSKGRWRDILSYNDVDAMRVIRGRLDNDCMDMVRLYNEKR